MAEQNVQGSFSEVRETGERDSRKEAEGGVRTYRKWQISKKDKWYGVKDEK